MFPPGVVDGSPGKLLRVGYSPELSSFFLRITREHFDGVEEEKENELEE